MGDEDGIVDGLINFGRNKVKEFAGGYFSFALGNEIALMLDDAEDYYILNCSSSLWDEVVKKCEEKGVTRKEIISFWKEKAKEYPCSGWSADFSKMK